MTPYQLFLYSLATFRLAYFISSEDGPMWIARKFRREVKKKAPKSIHLDDGISCAYCCGLWVAILIVLFSIFEGLLPRIVQIMGDTAILILAVAGGGVILHQLFTKLRGE